MQSIEPLRKARFETEIIDGTEWIVARAARNWFVIPFISVWLFGWTLGGITAITQWVAGGEARLFLSLWLIGWALGWYFAVSWLGWQINGRSMTSVEAGALVYRWTLLGFARTKRFDADQVRHVRAATAAWPWNFMRPSQSPFFPGTSGSVKFDYGGRDVSIMPGLDEAEGRMIADWLAKRLASHASGPGKQN